ncbi:hypothetical protein BDZ91DRAFT_731479 [Kalaharituber pfeilii]|nr:hypothetical protein BDZ91DRAFT_731479 [Kalaharituber pfeilii]
MRKYIQAIVTLAWKMSSGVTSARWPPPAGLGSFGNGRWYFETSFSSGASRSERYFLVSGLLKFGDAVVFRWIWYSVDAVKLRQLLPGARFSTVLTSAGTSGQSPLHRAVSSSCRAAVALALAIAFWWWWWWWVMAGSKLWLGEGG